MTANTPDPSKRVPKSLDTDPKLFGRYTLTDVAVALFPGVVVLLVTQLVIGPGTGLAGVSSQMVALLATAIAITIGVLLVSLTPRYTSSAAWLRAFFRYCRRPTRLDHQSAMTVTQVERVHPVDGAIERSDGALLGMVEVKPPAMALATEAQWAAKADAFEDFLNTVVEFPIQLYATTHRFPVEAYLERFESRLEDPDVKANRRLGMLIERYVEWYADELESRRMTIREHYVVVVVKPSEVRFELGGAVGRIAAVPVVGTVVEVLAGLPADRRRAAMVEALTERLRRVETGLRKIDGCSSQRVDAPEAARLIAEFWSGEPREYGDLDRVFRRRPYVGGAQ